MKMLEQTEKNKLCIIDTETTGLAGYPHDKILQIAVVELDLDTWQYEVVVNETIRYPIDFEIEDCWIVGNGYITLDEIANGKSYPYVVHKVKEAVKGKDWTCFNVDFDYFKFLQHEPWSLHRPSFCLMERMTHICKIPGYYDRYKWPKLEEAFYHYFKKWPSVKHTAESDTIMSTQIAIEYLKTNGST